MTESFEGSARGFSWTGEAREGILTIRIAGELDLALTTGAGERLSELVKRDERVIVVDLHAVTFMDSSGLRFLVTMRNEAQERGARLLLGKLSPAVKRVIDIAGLSDWFESVGAAAF